MKRKLFYLLLSSFFFLLTPISLINQKVFAEQVTCHAINEAKIDFTYSPEFPDKSITAKVDTTAGQLPTGDWYLNATYNPEGATNESAKTHAASGPVRLDGTTKTISLTLEPKSVPGTLFLTFGKVGASVFTCSTNFTITKKPSDGGSGGGGGTGSCKINPVYPNNQDHFTPNDLISFKVTNLPIDGANRRGVIVQNKTDLNNIISSCATNDALAQGYTVNTPIYGDYLPTGSYLAKITKGCFELFSTPDGPVQCAQPFNVCADKNCTPLGGKCDPDNNTCSKDAPHCIEKAPDSKNFVCSTAPKVEDQCRANTDGTYTCQTAIGPIGTSPQGFIKSVMALVLSLAGGILLLFLIINGYKLMTSQGDPEKVKEARESITAAIAGLLFIIFSLVVLQFVTTDILRLPGFNP